MTILDKIQKERGGIANVHKAFMSFPKGVEAHYEFYKKIILDDDLPLSRLEREILAVETSKTNQCPYCIEHHQIALENNSNLGDFKNEKLVILKLLAKELTLTPWRASILKEQFHDGGFNEEQWHHALMVVSYFNFVNRCVHGANVQMEDEFIKLCK